MKFPRVSFWWIGVSLIVAVLLIVMTMLGLRSADHAPQDSQYFVVQPRPLSKSVRLSGVIAPGAATPVVAPFSGAIINTAFTIGQQVKAGDALLTLDTKELEVQLNEAKSAMIQSGQKLAELRDWKSSADVLRAQRGMQRSEQQLQKFRRDVAEARKLYTLGIVAKQEVDGLVDQEREASNSLASAREELAGAMRKGGQHALQIATIEFSNAKYKLQQIENKIAAAKVIAPADGVVIQPPASAGEGAGTQESRELTAGVKATEGQKLLIIGSTDRLQIRTRVPEADIDALKVGLPVRATAIAFPDGVIHGHIAIIASQAGKDNDAGMPGFDVTVSIDRWESAPGRKIRLGMSVNVDVIVLERANALVIPPSAIASDGQNHAVRRRNARTGAVERVPVTLGVSLPEGVEILSGLVPGDEIVR